jgi:L-threonylcarbamoyladenylate synthase
MKTGIVGKNEISRIVGVLEKGGIIVFPTETSYGLGANALNKKAILKVHKAKKQPTDKPISIIVPSTEAARKFGKINKAAEKLVKKFMPGPFTLIVEKQKKVPNVLSKKTIAFRISSNKTANAIAKKFDGAITATSANLHGEEPIYSFSKALKVFDGKVDLIVDAENLRRRSASTIYDMTQKKVIRKGQISEREILKVIGG